jgi:hypothetical protein
MGGKRFQPVTKKSPKTSKLRSCFHVDGGLRMKYLFLTLFSLGLMVPLACTNTSPTNGTGSRAMVPTATPLNLSPTPAYIGNISSTAPNGIAYSGGLIYVAQGDAASVSQVSAYPPTSGSSATWTWSGSGSNTFQYPIGVAANSGGTTIYVLDTNASSGAGTVYAMPPSSTPSQLATWSTYNSAALNTASGIALDTNNNVYVSNAGIYNSNVGYQGGQLYEFSPTGTAIAAWSVVSGSGGLNTAPSAVALDSGNTVYVADGNNNQLWVLTYNGSNSFNVTTSWNLPFTYYGSQETVGDYGLAVDASKNVYVADYWNSQVEVYTNTGTLIGLFTGTGAGTLGGPDGILIQGSNIYVADYDIVYSNNTAGLIDIFGPNTY